jgi:ParB-like chromosome segregation protein Spo0J
VTDIEHEHDEHDHVTDTEIAQTSRDVRMVPLKTLWLEHDKWVNPRTIISEAEIASIATSVKDKGILVPLAVVQVRTPTGDIINLVIDGQQRCLAGRRELTEDALIPVRDVRDGIIEELTWAISDELLALALDIGIRRTPLSSYELCETAERLRGRNRTGTEIARMINRSESWVSRMCKARLSASQPLLARWRRGELTDEQFKDLASEKDPAQQAANAKQVVEARKGGNKGEARMLAREAGAKAKASKAENKPDPKPTKAKPAVAAAEPKGKPARSSEQAELPIAPAAPPAPPKMVPLPKAVIEDIVAMASRRPPVHDYVRGVIDMATAVIGGKDLATFAKPWAQYVSRLGGTTSAPAKPAKKPKGKGKNKGRK